MIGGNLIVCNTLAEPASKSVSFFSADHEHLVRRAGATRRAAARAVEWQIVLRNFCFCTTFSSVKIVAKTFNS